jgi:hypothetical protein
MNSTAQRKIGPPEGELVSPKVRQWRKSLDLVVANALANNRALLARLDRGAYAPPIQADYEHNQEIFLQLCRRTREQIAALESFTTVDWMDGDE